MKRLLTMAAAVASLLYLAVTFAPPAETQIGYTGYSGATSITTSADFIIGDNQQLCIGTDCDFVLKYTSGGDIFSLNDDGETNGLGFLQNAPDAASTDGFEFDMVVGIGDSSDTYRALVIDVQNADHTGSGNILHGISIDAITGDTEATESAIVVGTGWDRLIQTSLTSALIEIPATGSISIFNSAANIFTVDDLSTTTQVTNAENPHGNTSGTHISLLYNFSTLTALNGSDTYSNLRIDLDNADHTGSSNNVYGLYVDAITGDAQATESAIYIDTGWDSLISFNDTAGDISFGGGVSGTLNWTSVGDTSTLIQMNGISSNQPYLEIEGPLLTAAGRNKLFRVGPSSIGAMDGSDLNTWVEVAAFTDGAHTSTGNDVIAFYVNTITSPDADATHSILGAQGGWDYLIWNDAALGTDAWTTATDKTANAKSGTLKVEINGTLYHIQLYADS